MRTLLATHGSTPTSAMPLDPRELNKFQWRNAGAGVGACTTGRQRRHRMKEALTNSPTQMLSKLAKSRIDKVQEEKIALGLQIIGSMTPQLCRTDH